MNLCAKNAMQKNSPAVNTEVYEAMFSFMRHTGVLDLNV